MLLTLAVVLFTPLIVVQAGYGARSIAVRSKEVSVPFEHSLREHSSSATTNYVTRITCLHTYMKDITCCYALIQEYVRTRDSVCTYKNSGASTDMHARTHTHRMPVRED